MWPMSTFLYIKNFLSDKNVASVTPSSSACVRHVCRKIDFRKRLTVFEYGPGNGVFSRYLLDHMTGDSRLILIELNARFAALLKQWKDPRMSVVEESAEAALRIAEDMNIESADYVISGIPFSFLNESQKQDVLRETYALLKPGGKFLAYQTSGHLKNPVRKVFGNLRTEVELRNIPPMLIYEARKQPENGLQVPE